MTGKTITQNLDQTITTAVEAQVQAQVAAALINNDTFKVLVTASLNQMVEVPDGPYGKKRVSMIDHLVQNAVAQRTKEVVVEQIAELVPEITKEIKTALRKSVGVIADSLVDGFVASAPGRGPSIKVEFRSDS